MKTTAIAAVMGIVTAIGGATLPAPVLAGGSGGALSIEINPRNSDEAAMLRGGLLIYALTRQARSGALVEQRGSGNGAALAQIGQGNLGVVHQQGRGNDASLGQYGNDNAYGVFQFGRNNSGHVRQTGNGGTGALIQLGW